MMSNKQPKKKRTMSDFLIYYVDLLFEIILLLPRAIIAFFRSLF